MHISDRKTVAFMAQLSKEMVNPPQHTVGVFDSVLTNVGGAYKSSSGVFLAPVNGTYTIHLVATASRKKTSEYVSSINVTNKPTHIII
jgi:hypothetical protein